MIQFSHAINNEPVDVEPTLVAAVYRIRMEKIGPEPVTVILFNGGAMLPVKEAREDVTKKLNTKQGENTDVS